MCMAKQLDLFCGEYEEPKANKLEDYDGFLNKFANKKTTDDCYTPEPVYDAVLGWCRERYGIGEGVRIVRPFWPGGDFEQEDYSGECVVVDNPPFSILSKIVRWFTARGIRFFLFAPYLRSMGCSQWCTIIVAAQPIIYANGAEVPTGFVTNMEGSTLAMSAPDLRERVKEAVEQTKVFRHLPRYVYPGCVLTESMLGYLASHGTALSIDRREASQKIYALASTAAVT